MKSLEEIQSVLEYSLKENEDATRKVLSTYQQMNSAMPDVDVIKDELNVLIKNNYNIAKTIKHVKKAIKSHSKLT